nr:hypothetical protein CFP56_68233 [Quercus suber]
MTIGQRLAHPDPIVMSLKKMIRKMMNELGEAVEEVNFAQLKLKKAENNVQCFPFLTWRGGTVHPLSSD